MNRKKTAFTLIELLIAVSIVGILAAIGIPSYNGYQSAAAEKKAESLLMTIALIEQDAYADNREYLDTNAGDSNKLGSLLEDNNNIDDKYTYSILSADTTSFKAQALLDDSDPKECLIINEKQEIDKSNNDCE
jgi:prepilin-type N-terminal cleavage/methylation domain-containing protein